MFTPGQRWISDTETELGLGTVMRLEGRTITVFFHAGGEMRTYASHNAPLSRVKFGPGDSVESHEGWTLKIDHVDEHDGLLTYSGKRTDTKQNVRLPEGELSNFLQLNKPQERLLTGQTDPAHWFRLRYETLAKRHQIMQAPVRGLCGARVDLLAHQLFIAWEVANRYAPRVLLADEVGLGKTIEAGLIIHQQLLSGRATRVLLVVPETLIHQWLVEMRRRFNLSFSIFDDSRLESSPDMFDGDNPFHDEQLVLCSLDFLVQAPQWQQFATDGNWDLLVVDEAQHLAWSETRVSDEYHVVEQLAAQTAGILLLTATPEQLGKAGHFARLRLLDPQRFFSYAEFIEEESRYEPVAEAVQHLLDGKKLPPASLNYLAEALGEADSARLLDVLNAPRRKKADKEAFEQARAQLIEDLLDRHGTGRVLFRNTRAAIGGFPERRVNFYPLQLPEQYQACLQHLQEGGGAGRVFSLNPELCYQSILDQSIAEEDEDPEVLKDEREALSKVPTWWQFDPRVLWLLDKVSELRPDKVLVICAHARLAIDLDQALSGAGIPSTVFHEGLSLVQRDRAGAYFAAQEEGARVLVCSEIGSEGRNFQFAHHLVLFDLPLNPDLLEQRIGRLDRIGQQHTIDIHVPYLENSPQDVLRRWYHEGLNAFEQTCPAGHDVFMHVRPQLVSALQTVVHGAVDISDLLELSRDLYEELNEQLHRGRDRLLELHSCRPAVAAELITAISEQDADTTLERYLEQIFDVYGVVVEDHSENCLLITPGDNMLVPSFPEMGEDGAVLTFTRATALSRDEIQFITWEHPLVLGAIDLVLNSGLGNTALSAFKHASIAPGTLLLEVIYVLECVAPRHLQPTRFLPPTPIRVVVDKRGKALDLSYTEIKTQSVDKQTANQVIRSQAEFLRAMLPASDKLAHAQAAPLLAQVRKDLRQRLTSEIVRLQTLQAVNPNVREEEISLLQAHLDELDTHMQAAQLRMDALRVLVGM